MLPEGWVNDLIGENTLHLSLSLCHTYTHSCTHQLYSILGLLVKHLSFRVEVDSLLEVELKDQRFCLGSHCSAAVWDEAIFT